MNKNYRLCAGAIVFNKNKQVLLGSRIDSPNTCWQFPQGGIEANETTIEAAKRELFEEMNLNNVKLIYPGSNSYYYDFSLEIKNKFKEKNLNTDGQCITFSLFFYNGNNTDISVNTANPEFKEYIWGDFNNAIDTSIEFKKDIYIKIKEKFLPIIDDYINNLS